MSEYQQIAVDKPRPKVARVTLNRPEKLNATTMLMMQELGTFFRMVKRDADTHVVIVRGAGRAFCAGHDLKEVPEREPYALSHDEWFIEQKAVFDDIDMYRRMIADAPQPVIAQIHGHVYTVGIELAMSCDLVYAADDLKMPIRLAGGAGRYIHLLPWLVGIRRAKEILFRGSVITGEEAARLGIANGVIPRAELDDHVLQVAEQIGRVPLEFLALDKQATNKSLDLMGARDAIDYSATLHAVSHRTAPGLAQFEGLYLSGDWRKAAQERDSRYSGG
jgi:enoyl-CoA hydratase